MTWTRPRFLLTALLVLLAIGAGAFASAWFLGRARSPHSPAHSAAAPDPQALIAPVTQALLRVEQQLAATERHRAEAHGQLQEQVRTMNETSQLLRTEASSLGSSASRPADPRALG